MAEFPPPSDRAPGAHSGLQKVARQSGTRAPFEGVCGSNSEMTRGRRVPSALRTCWDPAAHGPRPLCRWPPPAPPALRCHVCSQSSVWRRAPLLVSGVCAPPRVGAGRGAHTRWWSPGAQPYSGGRPGGRGRRGAHAWLGPRPAGEPAPTAPVPKLRGRSHRLTGSGPRGIGRGTPGLGREHASGAP